MQVYVCNIYTNNRLGLGATTASSPRLSREAFFLEGRMVKDGRKDGEGRKEGRKEGRTKGW